MKRILLLLTVLITVSGCIYDIDEILLQREDISMTVKGAEQFVYDPVTCQLGYNEAENEFRVLDDNLGHWFIVKCSSRPTTPGQEIRADLTWTTADNIRKKKGLKFTVKKTRPDGLIWMWCKSDKIGVTVKEI